MVDIITDPWSPLTHKDWDKVGSFPNYLDDETIRRLTAYIILSAYMENIAREVLPDTSQVAESELQEFGDAAVLVERVAAGVLGSEPQLAIVGADEQVPEEPDTGPEPSAPNLEGTDPRVAEVLNRKFELAITNWAQNAAQILDDWEALATTTPLLRQRQDWLRNWAQKERFIGRMQENENENVVAKGDGCIVVGWDANKRRPTVEIFNPAAYIPELDNFQPTEFPDRVHLVWNYEDTDDAGETVKYVRRVTYELLPITEVEQFAQARYITGDETQTVVCVHTDATWLEADFDDVYNPTTSPNFYGKIPDPANPADPEAEIDIDQLNTGLDFIPVIHLPNTLSTEHHFGRALLSRLSQLLDEIQASATDESMCSRWAAQPPIVIDGLPIDTVVDLTAGQGISGKRIDSIDMSSGLMAIMDRSRELQKFLSTNSQVPDGLRGRVDAKDVPSGLALTLSFTPFVQLIGRLREARSSKYPLLLKFVQRIAIQNLEESGIDSDQVYEAEIQYGAFMPQDLSATAEVVARLFNAGIISLKTALVELSANGLTIDDLQAEIAAIRIADGEGAARIFDATGSDQAVADYMGKEYEREDEADGVDVEGGNVGGIGAPEFPPAVGALSV